MSKRKVQDSPLYVYDFTAPKKGNSFDIIKACLLKYCKAWCFQLEKGESEKRGEAVYIHYQGRFSLHTKRRIDDIGKLMAEDGVICHLSATSNSHKRDYVYVTKEDARVKGPWRDTDPEARYMQKRFNGGEIEWYPWQISLKLEMLETPDDRTINVLLTPKGNQGRSFLSMYALCSGLAMRLPNVQSSNDFLQMAYDVPESRCYMIDIPRADGMAKTQLMGLVGGIEELKNGYVYDKRNRFHFRIQEPPHVWIFCNDIPPVTAASRDRWKFWRISKNRELKSSDKRVWRELSERAKDFAIAAKDAEAKKDSTDAILKELLNRLK